MDILIDVESPLGTKLGSGPITTATNWKYTQRLDRAGEWSFTMPVDDPDYFTLIAQKRFVRCRAIVRGAWRELGLGPIESVVIDSNVNPSMATISGPDMLRELTYRTVKGLEIAETGYVLPEDIHHVTLNSSGNGLEANPNNYQQMTNWYDGNGATWTEIFNMADPYQYWYIGYSHPFDQIIFTLNQANLTTVTTATVVQYFNGTAWVNLSYGDGTSVGGVTFKVTGSWSFTPPADWVPLVQNCVGTGGVTNNLNSYWLRFRMNGWGYDHIRIAEVVIRARIPTLTGAALIMALAPAGWSLALYTSTLTSVYLQLSDETILEALGKLAALTGEHFRIAPLLGGGAAQDRQVQWLRKDATATGITAFRNGQPALVETNVDGCLIGDLKLVQESHDMVSRVIPYGAGSAAARTTLLYTTRTAPAGYTLNAALNYIKRDASETAYGQIEHVMAWPGIGPASSAKADLAPAANALFDTAFYWLSTHSDPVTTWAATVYALPRLVAMGNTIVISWQEPTSWPAGVWNVNAALIILDATYTVDQDGVFSVVLTVSPLARWPLSENEAIAQMMSGQRAMQSIAQATPLETIRSKNAAISVVRTGNNFGGVNYN